MPIFGLPSVRGVRKGTVDRSDVPSRRCRLRRCIPLIGAVLLLGLVFPVFASASAVLDGFSRTGTVDRWDVADGSGGPYTYVNDDTAKFVQANSVTGDCTNPCAYIAAPTAGSYRQANLTETLNSSTTLRDVNMHLDFELGTMPVAGSVRISVIARTGGTNGIDGYLGSVAISPAGAVTYGATKAYGTGPTTADIGTWASNGTTFTADTWWHIHFEVYSTSSTATHLRMRVWKTTEQSTWPYDLTSNTQTELQTSGYVGVRSTRGSGVTNTVRAYFDNFQVDNIDTPPTAPADPGVSGGSATWTTGSRTITASSATVGSFFGGGTDSIDHYEHRTLSDGAVSSITSGNSVTVSTSGTTFAQFRAVDPYGNTSDWYPSVAEPAGEARIDTTAPNPPVVAGGLPTAVVGPVTVSAYGSSDPGDGSGLSVDGNGLPSFQYRTSTDNGATWSSAATATKEQLTISTTGTTLVQFRSVDNAGNTSSWAGPSSYAGGSTDDASNHVTISSGGSTGTDACSFFKDSLNRTGHITSAYESGDGLVHLTAAASPYIINCVFTDDAGAPLDIEPGTVLEFGTNDTFGINSTATIGSSTDARPVVFESAARGSGTGSPGQWGGVQLNEPSNSSTITNARFSDGGSSTGTTPTFNAYNSGNATIDQSVFSGNKTDLCCSTKPGVVEVQTVGPDTTPATLTVTHTQIVDNKGNGAKSDDATLTINHDDLISRNDGYGVYLVTAGSTVLSGFNPGTVNNSDIIDNGENGIFVNIGGADTSLYVTASSGSHNNLSENGETSLCDIGNGCKPGEIKVVIPSGMSPSTLMSFDFTNNYLGQTPYEYNCLTDTGYPGNVPVDSFFLEPYQMINGLYMELNNMIDEIEARATQNVPITKALLQYLAEQVGVTPGALGINPWTAMSFSSGGPDDLEVDSQDGSKHCYYDEVPTAPASFTEFDNSGQ